MEKMFPFVISSYFKKERRITFIIIFSEASVKGWSLRNPVKSSEILLAKFYQLLHRHFSEHRSFSEATKHRPGVDELIGVHGYKDYKLASDLDAKIDYLRHCGLNDEEIAIKMRQDMGIKVSTISLQLSVFLKELLEIP